MQIYADQIRRFVPRTYHVLGTDGFGRSDTRTNLRAFFEVDSRHIAATALKTLTDDGKFKLGDLKDAYRRLEIDPEKPDPFTA